MSQKVKCCYQCPKRTGDCHSSCPDYAVEKAFANVELDERIEKIKLASGLRAQTARCWDKARRKRNGR